ncbi:B3 domain-containing protein REM20 isoform X2 [Spinacia oleracea]|nr:B3 domain-containing protein REM20-like isoform X2 [Spinacia oleracea]XP_056698347.1 B3 domain-containing protein REM20-like isoform X2 [Spinacia oleracea]XP_056698348.1 B3 domain-containing protein REM20-like isoform X2 [Spinacia oleracea]
MGSSSDKHPQFFKVFQPQTSSENLMLPPAFESKLSGEIPSRVVLKKNKKIWLINVVRIDGRLHFEGAWSKFVLDNSLSFGEFMVFKYNGQRTFDVLILGRDGCEKESGNTEETEDSEEEPVVKHVDDDDDDYGNAEETEESEEEHVKHVDDDYEEDEDDEDEDEDDDDDDYTMPKHFLPKYNYNSVQGKTNSIWG